MIDNDTRANLAEATEALVQAFKLFLRAVRARFRHFYEILHELTHLQQIRRSAASCTAAELMIGADLMATKAARRVCWEELQKRKEMDPLDFVE